MPCFRIEIRWVDQLRKLVGKGWISSQFNVAFKSDLGVSENSGFSPQIIHFDRVFHYKPSILGYPYFWNTHLQCQLLKLVAGLL